MLLFSESRSSKSTRPMRDDGEAAFVLVARVIQPAGRLESIDVEFWEALSGYRTGIVTAPLVSAPDVARLDRACSYSLHEFIGEDFRKQINTPRAYGSVIFSAPVAKSSWGWKTILCAIARLTSRTKYYHNSKLVSVWLSGITRWSLWQLWGKECDDIYYYELQCLKLQNFQKKFIF